ncbi:pyruvate kinase [Bordetella genomosp. 7]|uniref:Pyruvate kinase n=1 Tax=Bordetella genomosp. 7 TaxID=1416805 RepID=A0A261RHF0_9BORD|nr:pyruvate kinase [Bordetella genomosp. 7]OZI24464.1 pyruvate kinase [Bordetella genomosp. 7]OZI28506.1 pyruvate kinase [Bordetella genomosp. 7]
MSVMRRTKIVATLGPSTSTPEQLEALVRAGVDVARLNFSHGTADDHRERARLVREIAAKQGRFVAIMGDLQGPKIRIARFADRQVVLRAGQPFTLSNSHPKEAGDSTIVGIDYPELVQDCQPGDELLLDDGRVVLVVDRVADDSVHTTVTVGGPLSNNKGINRRGGGLSAPSLTDKDRADILVAAELELDYVAVSFPRYGRDIEEARQLVRAAGSQAWIIAKIERAEAVADDEALDLLIRASDGVMVARGDLGVEVGDAELVGIQKRIIQHARTLNKVVITATQMMESMISSPLPTRAEVSDVANAVLDYTDAVMLSAESASGQYPVEAVQAMARVCLGAEKHPTTTRSHHRLGETFSRCDETIALAAMYAANHFPGVKAIIALTESGHTPLIMSRIRSGVPIYCYSPHRITQHRVAMFRGVYTVPFDASAYDPADLSTAAIDELKKRGRVQPGDWVILTKGDFYRDSGGTNGMKILMVE